MCAGSHEGGPLNPKGIILLLCLMALERDATKMVAFLAMLAMALRRILVAKCGAEAELELWRDGSGTWGSLGGKHGARSCK